MRRCRRLLAFVGTLLFMVAVTAAMRQPELPTHQFRITLGLQDQQPTDWNGQVGVRDGEAVALTGWRFDAMDAVQGVTGWKCRTKEYIAPEKRYPLMPASGQPKPAELRPWPNGVYLSVRGAAPTITL